MRLVASKQRLAALKLKLTSSASYTQSPGLVEKGFSVSSAAPIGRMERSPVKASKGISKLPDAALPGAGVVASAEGRTVPGPVRPGPSSESSGSSSGSSSGEQSSSSSPSSAALESSSSAPG